MTIRTGDTNVATDSTLFPTNQWNAAVLTQTRVLNTLTGRTLRRAKTAIVLRSPTRRCVFRALLPDSFSRY